MKFFKLVGKEPVGCSMAEWSLFMEEGSTVLKQEDVGAYRVSTVFLGIDHSFGRGKPLLFETMIFTSEKDPTEYQRRCATWNGAIAQHLEACKEAKRLNDLRNLGRLT